MRRLSEIDIFTFGLNLLEIAGEYIERTSKKIIIIRLVNCVAYITSIVFIASNLGDPTSREFVTGLENFATVFHTFFKYLMFMYYKNYLRELMEAKLKNFWKIPHEYTALSNKIRIIYKGINLLQLVMLIDVILIMEFYILTPIIYPNSPFIFASNVFVNSIVLDVFVLFCQYHAVAIMTPIVLGYDFVYLCLCSELKVQVKLLKYKLKEVFTDPSGDVLSAICNCVRYHIFLLSMHDKMQKMYSNVLLFHYFVSLITLCFDMYQSFLGQADLSHEIHKFISLAAVVAQFAFYCIPAELLSSEFMDIAQAVYMSKWYKGRPDIQKLMLPIMVKCQKPHYFSAAGLLDINIDAFGSVIRKAFSFCAVMRNLLDK